MPHIGLDVTLHLCLHVVCADLSSPRVYRHPLVLNIVCCNILHKCQQAIQNFQSAFDMNYHVTWQAKVIQHTDLFGQSMDKTHEK